MYEDDRNNIINNIDNLIKAIEERFLKTFENLEDEAKDIEKETLNQLARQYQGGEDPSYCYEVAHSAGAKYYWIYEEMKNDFLNMTTVWLYHMFEKDCNIFFSDEKWGLRKAKLNDLSISITSPSNFYMLNEELQHMCDINKHGNDSRAKAKLYEIRPDLFDSKTKYNFKAPNSTVYTLKNIKFEQLKKYAEHMKVFRNELYEALQLEKYS